MQSADARQSLGTPQAEEVAPRRSKLTESMVDEIYTFGAPGTASHTLRNAASEDQCFGGLRSYAENKIGWHGSLKMFDAGAFINRYDHSAINSVCLFWRHDSEYAPCGTVGAKYGHSRRPIHGWDRHQDWRLHHEYVYFDRLRFISYNDSHHGMEEPFRSAWKYIGLAYRVYEPILFIKDGIRRDLPGWSLIAHFVYRRHRRIFSDTDPVMLVQEDSTKDCVLSFCGTNSVSELSSSALGRPTDFCGFEQVHSGWKNEVMNLARNVWGEMRPHLETCNRLICVGHSMGGSMCEVFSACVNSGNVTDPDYQTLIWRKRARMNRTEPARR